MFRHLLFLILIATALAACESGGGGSGVSSDADTDTDADSDTDSDADSDSDSDSDTDSDSDSDSDGDSDACADIPWEVEYNPINMLVLLDRSWSMHESTIGPDSYAAVVAAALEDVVETNIDAGLVNFSLAVFPSLFCTGGSAGDDTQNCKPAASEYDDPGYGAPVVNFDADMTDSNTNFDEIQLALSSVGQCGGTPICQSLQWALDYLNWTGATTEYPANPLPGDLSDQPKFILLATDGAPNCNPAGDIGSCDHSDPDAADVPHFPEECLDDICTYNAALQLANAGIPVFVIGVGDSLASWDEEMNNIADWGGTGSYYPATDASDLQTALEEITGAAITCEFYVEWEESEGGVPDQSPDPPYTFVDKACDKVWVLGVPTGATDSSQYVEMAYMNDCASEDPGSGLFGWHWQGIDLPAEDLDTIAEELDQCNTIELCPEACNMLKEGEWETVTAKFGCSIIID